MTTETDFRLVDAAEYCRLPVETLSGWASKPTKESAVLAVLAHYGYTPDGYISDEVYGWWASESHGGRLHITRAFVDHKMYGRRKIQVQIPDIAQRGAADLVSLIARKCELNSRPLPKE